MIDDPMRECENDHRKMQGSSGDQGDREAVAINAAHPMRTGRHDLYAQAMKLVGARHAKHDLVQLVNWLLAERDALQARLEAMTGERALTAAAKMKWSQEDGVCGKWSMWEDYGPDVHQEAREIVKSIIAAAIQATEG